jgi:hypothetical protein
VIISAERGAAPFPGDKAGSLRRNALYSLRAALVVIGHRLYRGLAIARRVGYQLLEYGLDVDAPVTASTALPNRRQGRSAAQLCIFLMTPRLPALAPPFALPRPAAKPPPVHVQRREFDRRRAAAIRATTARREEPSVTSNRKENAGRPREGNRPANRGGTVPKIPPARHRHGWY